MTDHADIRRRNMRLLLQQLGAWFDADPGATVRSAAAALAEAGLPRTSKSHVFNIVNGDVEPTADEVAALVKHLSPEAIASGAARLAGGAYLPSDREPPAPVSVSEHALRLGAATGRLQACIVAALADGLLEAREGEQVEGLIDEQIARLQALRGTVRQHVGQPRPDEPARRQVRP